jgi:DNA-binding GntR family transcriptional regulator
MIRDGILRGDLPVGSVLNETALATSLESSRTPVRQALRLLLQEGLVEVGARRQLIVRGLSDEHRDEILLIRSALETAAVRRACEVMTLEEIDYLRPLLIQQRRAARAEDEDAFLDLDEEFHLRIAEGARLPMLRRYLEQLRGFVRLLRLGSRRSAEQLLHVAAEHEEIVDALESRDAEAAIVALNTHLYTSQYALVGRTDG